MTLYIMTLFTQIIQIIVIIRAVKKIIASLYLTSTK